MCAARRRIGGPSRKFSTPRRRWQHCVVIFLSVVGSGPAPVECFPNLAFPRAHSRLSKGQQDLWHVTCGCWRWTRSKWKRWRKWPHSRAVLPDGHGVPHFWRSRRQLRPHNLNRLRPVWIGRTWWKPNTPKNRNCHLKVSFLVFSRWIADRRFFSRLFPTHMGDGHFDWKFETSSFSPNSQSVLHFSHLFLDFEQLESIFLLCCNTDSDVTIKFVMLVYRVWKSPSAQIYVNWIFLRFIIPPKGVVYLRFLRHRIDRFWEPRWTVILVFHTSHRTLSRN
jgi:hypothetical protein